MLDEDRGGFVRGHLRFTGGRYEGAGEDLHIRGLSTSERKSVVSEPLTDFHKRGQLAALGDFE